MSIHSIIFKVVWMKMKEVISLRQWCPHSALWFLKDMPFLLCLLFSFLISVDPLFHFIWHRGWQMAFFGLTVFVCVCPESCLILRKCIFHTVLKKAVVNKFILTALVASKQSIIKFSTKSQCVLMPWWVEKCQDTIKAWNYGFRSFWLHPMAAHIVSFTLLCLKSFWQCKCVHQYILAACGEQKTNFFYGSQHSKMD